CLYKDKLFIIGGYSEGSTIQEHCFLDMKNLKWNPFQTNNSPKVAKHTAVVYKDFIYVFGGESYESVGSNELYEYSILSDQWKRIDYSGDVPEKTTGHTAVTIHDSMFVYGGGERNKTCLNSIYEYKFVNRTWKKIDIPLVPKRKCHTSAVLNSKMYFFGGRPLKRVYFNDLYCIDFRRRQLTKLCTFTSGTLPRERVFTSMVA